MGISFIRPKVLGIKLIPDPHEELLGVLKLSQERPLSIGLISADFDHALFVALDEATKFAPVEVHVTRSLYGESQFSQNQLMGKSLGVLAGADEEVVRHGLKVVSHSMERILYYKVDDSAPSIFFSHVVSSVGTFLSKQAQINVGESLAYLMAPPVEALVALDAALKAAQVRVAKYFAPPTETNYGGALLTGPLQECEAAVEAFKNCLSSIGQSPQDPLFVYSFEKKFQKPSSR